MRGPSERASGHACMHTSTQRRPTSSRRKHSLLSPTPPPTPQTSHLFGLSCPHHNQLPVLQSHQDVAALLCDRHTPHRDLEGQRGHQSVQAVPERGAFSRGRLHSMRQKFQCSVNNSIIELLTSIETAGFFLIFGSSFLPPLPKQLIRFLYLFLVHIFLLLICTTYCCNYGYFPIVG